MNVALESIPEMKASSIQHASSVNCLRRFSWHYKRAIWLFLLLGACSAHAQHLPADRAPQSSSMTDKQNTADDELFLRYENELRANPSDKQVQDDLVALTIKLALAARRDNDPGLALAYLLRARKSVPNNPTLLLDFGIQAESMRIYKDAELALAQALALQPSNATTLYALAHVELDEQKMPQAEDHLRKYLRTHPNDATAHYGLGRLLYMLLRMKEAEAEFNQSIQLQPAQTESYYELGQIKLSEQDNSAAQSFYEKVIVRNPHHAGALTGLGIIAFHEKRFADAEKYLRQAVLYAPEYPSAHSYLGMTLAHLGKENEAAAQMKLAAKATEAEDQSQHGNFIR